MSLLPPRNSKADRPASRPGYAPYLSVRIRRARSTFATRARRRLPPASKAFRKPCPATIGEAELLALIARLNADDRVDGILVQLPLPKHIDPQRVIDAIDPGKDVDGFHVQNVGQLWSGGLSRALVPCTPYGCLLLLRDALPNLTGAEAVVLGRSNIVGKPMAALLLARELHGDAGAFQDAATFPPCCAVPTF